VTSLTRFAIASATKAFTATAAAILADEGKLNLDVPVREYLPKFRLNDPVATERVTVRDLLCHRTGVPEYPLAWYRAGLTRRRLVGRLRHLEPTADLRQKFQYQNLMYTAVGAVIEAISGMPFEEFVQTRVFDRLGMANAGFYTPSLRRDAQVAKGYRLVNGKRRAVAHYDDRATSPAGGIYACLDDMCKWVSMNLDGGVYKDVRVVSERSLRDCHSPHMAIPLIPTRSEFYPLSYGMGWWVTGYRGHLRLWHSGGIDGFCARVDLLPRDGIGVVLLSNLDAFPSPNADLLNYVIALRAYDMLLGLPPIDHNKRMRAVVSRAAGKRARGQRRPAARSASVERYVGLYRHPGHGVMEVCCGREGLVVSFRGRRAPIRQQAEGVFEGHVLCEDVRLHFIERRSRCCAVELRFGGDGQRVRFRVQRGARRPKA
jgi:CubicO group peptidase (beta-lactamase class C family)